MQSMVEGAWCRMPPSPPSAVLPPLCGGRAILTRRNYLAIHLCHVHFDLQLEMGEAVADDAEALFPRREKWRLNENFFA